MKQYKRELFSILEGCEEILNPEVITRLLTISLSPTERLVFKGQADNVRIYLRNVIDYVDNAGKLDKLIEEAVVYISNPEKKRILEGLKQQYQKQRYQAGDFLVNVPQDPTEDKEFDVFLCHNSEDKPAVKAIGEKLRKKGIRPWLDEWQFRPGLPWQKALESQIKHIKSAAVFIGPNGVGPWQDVEIEAFLREFIRREIPVIPVILKECDDQNLPTIPLFLQGMMWVDFRKDDPDPMNQIIWGVTGKKVAPNQEKDKELQLKILRLEVKSTIPGSPEERELQKQIQEIERELEHSS